MTSNTSTTSSSPTSTPTTPTTSSSSGFFALARAARLHPLGLDLASVLDEVIAAELRERIPEDVAASRELLAERSMATLVDVNPVEIPFAVNVVGLLNGVLALADTLDGPSIAPRCETAAANVGTLLSGVTVAVLRDSVRSLLFEIRDGVALEQGLRAFCAAARAALARLARIHPHMLDVLPSSKKILVGGRALSFRTTEKGRQRTRYLTRSNEHGRLVLLAAIAEAPRIAAPAVLSRARTAVRRATRGRFRLERDPVRVVPELRLTARARATALSILHEGRE